MDPETKPGHHQNTIAVVSERFVRITSSVVIILLGAELVAIVLGEISTNDLLLSSSASGIMCLTTLKLSKRALRS